MDRTKAIDFIKNFLNSSMSAKKQAQSFVSKNFMLTFTGGRRFERAGQIGEFNALRYKNVKKDIKDWDFCEYPDGRVVIYCLGTLYGEWRDGKPFEGNRFIDRFEIRNGLIEKIDVWNDSAEILLSRAGLAEDQK
ncbi:MAG: nuclear transport factor 2 family protein [Thermodesulfobacteriota bacterium]